MSQYKDAMGEPDSILGISNMLRALGVPSSGERIAQHTLVSGLLALEVLVTNSLPAAMLTQVKTVS